MSGTMPPERTGRNHREQTPAWVAGGGSSTGEASQRPSPDVEPPPPTTPAADLDSAAGSDRRVGDIADVGRRVSADLVDFLVLTLLGAVVGLLLDRLGFAGLLAPGARGEGGSRLGVSALPATLLTLAIHLGYWTLMEGRRGQSVGKLAFGIRAVREDVSALDYTTALKRHVLFYIPQVLAWVPSFAVLVLAAMAQAALVLGGLLTYILDTPLRQGFHDKFAGTIVVSAASTQ